MSQLQPFIELLASWQMVAIVAIISLRKPITLFMERLISGESGRAKIGPIEFELGELAKDGKEAIDKLNQVHMVIAESRLLELEVTQQNFSHSFTNEQSEKLSEIIRVLKRNISDAQ
ncbi:hypothetical protein [Marinobacter sp.]|uniref:hypothetical protein n=1 Tax=Marinobacter sp. TaxID=50741 RepID=UPI0035C7756E